MSDLRRISFEGFEVGFLTYIGANFRFSTEPLKNYAMEAGRHLFVQDMPEIEEIRQTVAGGLPYEPKREPTISVYTNPGPGLVPSSSSGSRHEWTLRVVLRLGTVPEEAKARLEELIAYVEKKLKGKKINDARGHRFIIKGVLVVIRPTVFAREGDNHAFCQSVVRFFAVPVLV